MAYNGRIGILFFKAGELEKMKKALLSLLVFPAMVNGVEAMDNSMDNYEDLYGNGDLYGNQYGASLNDSGISLDEIENRTDIDLKDYFPDEELTNSNRFDLEKSALLPGSNFDQETKISNKDKLNLAKSANLSELYFEHWHRNYEQNNIIDKLDLDEDEYSESIENIKQLGLSAISHSINGVDAELSVDELVEPFRDILITTGKGEKEDVIDYLDRLSISNYNYVVLENLLYMIAEKKEQSNTQELLDLIQVKIMQRTEQAVTATADSIMQKLASSIEDVKQYVKAGAVDMFIKQFLDNTDYKINQQNALFYKIDDIQIQQPYKLDASLAIKMLEERKDSIGDDNYSDPDECSHIAEENDEDFENSFKLFE